MLILIIISLRTIPMNTSVVDGVNVPARVYRIMTEVTEHGGSLEEGTTVTETARKNRSINRHIPLIK